MSSEFDVFDDAEPVTSDAEDSVTSEVDDYQAAAERHSSQSAGAAASVPTPSDSALDTADSDPLAACRFCEATFETRSTERLHNCSGRRRLSQADTDGLYPVVSPATHEFTTFNTFVGHGVAPYWALRRTFTDPETIASDVADAVDGFAFEGDRWFVTHEKTSAWRDGIAIPDTQREHCPPADADAETHLEFTIGLVADDPVGEKKVSVTVRPSFPDARKPDGSPVGGFPASSPEGVRIELNSANIHPRDVYRLLQRLAAELGVDPAFFALDNLHEWSRCTQLARYLRLFAAVSEEHIVSLGGLLERLSRFAPRAGGKGTHVWDDQDVSGHFEAIAMDQHGWSKLLPETQVAKKLKSYHPFWARSADSEDDDLRDPKLELQFATGRHLDDDVPWDGADPVPVQSDDGFDLFDLLDEFDRTLWNCLEWAGLPTQADEDVYAADQYFTVEDERRAVDFVADPMDDLEAAEGDLVDQHVARGDTSEGQRAVLADLLDSRDGKHWAQIRESAGVSKSTIYRAVQAFPGLLRVDDGHLSLEDRTVREKLRGALSVFGDVANWVRGQVQSLEDAVDETRLEDTPLLSWARRHGVTVDRGEDGFTLRFEGRRLSWYDLWTLVREGFDAARATGEHTAREFAETATVVYTNADGDRVADDHFIRRDTTQDRAVISGSAYNAFH